MNELEQLYSNQESEYDRHEEIGNVDNLKI